MKWVVRILLECILAVNDFDAKKSARYNQVLIVTVLVVSEAQCKNPMRTKLLLRNTLSPACSELD